MNNSIESNKATRVGSTVALSVALALTGLTGAADRLYVQTAETSNFKVGYGGTNVERLDWNKAKFQESQIRSLRFALPWEQIEPAQSTPPTYHFDEYFANLDGYDGSKTLEPVFWIGYNPGWIGREARRQNTRPWTAKIDGDPNNPTYFVRFVKNFAQSFKEHYPSRKLVLEIGNEVDCVDAANTDCFTGANGVVSYAQVLKDVRREVHQIDDSATVGTSGLALELLPAFKFSFFRELVAACPADAADRCFDAATIHFYSDLRNYSTTCNQAPDCTGQSYKEFWNLKGGREVSSKINYAIDTLSQHGYPEGFPIYITEAGTGLKLPNPSANYDFTPPVNVYDFYQETMLREMTRASSFTQVEGMYWYSIKDESWMYGPESWRCPAENDSCTSYGMHRLDLSEKSNIWQTFKHIALREDGIHSEKISNQPEPFEGYRFTAGNPDFIVAWSNTNQPVSYQPPFFEYDVEGPDGSILAENRRGILNLDSHPVFIMKENVEPSPTLAPTINETPTLTEKPPTLTSTAIFTQFLTATPLSTDTVEPFTPTDSPTATDTSTASETPTVKSTDTSEPTSEIKRRFFNYLPVTLRLLLKYD